MNTPALLPDLLLVGLAFAVLGLDLALGGRKRTTFHLAWLGLVVVFLLLLLPQESRTFLGAYRVSGPAALYKQLFVLSSLFTILLANSYFQPGQGSGQPLVYQNEFAAIIILSTFGMFTVVSSTDLLTLFIGMELATIPLYVLSGFRKNDDLSSEASTKYIIMGALSTAVAIFGYSFLYGCAGSLSFEAIGDFASSNPYDPMFRFGVLLVLAAVGFKLTLFPFHMWAPDVYEGSPTPVTAFLSVSSKATAIGFVMVLLDGPLAPIHHQLQTPLLILAAITMTIGNLGALRQHSLLRFMAYSSIAQAGYIVLAMASQTVLAKSAIVYYLLVYAAANYATFFIIAVLGRRRPEVLGSLQGMGRQNPVLAAVLMLAMFSLAGIPPLAGFTGKFMLFAAAAKEGYYAMVVFAALNSTVSLYYYLLLIKEAYITTPDSSLPALEITPIQRYSLAHLCLAMLLLGLMPSVSDGIMRIVGGV